MIWEDDKMIPNNDVARLLADDKVFGRAMAYLIAYVRKHAVVGGRNEHC